MRRVKPAFRTALLAVVVTAAAALSGCGTNTTQTQQNQSVVDTAAEKTQSTVTAEIGSVVSTLVVSGSVQASSEYAILAPVAGTVTYAEGKIGSAPETIIASVNGTAVSLGHTAKLQRRLVVTGDYVEAGVPIATATYSGFAVHVSIPATEVYRLYSQPSTAKVNIESGPSGIDCVIAPLLKPASSESVDRTSEAAGDQSATGTDSADAATPTSQATVSTVQTLCLLPSGTQAFEGLRARIALQTGAVEGVVTIPLTAVSGSVGTGEVWLVDPANPDDEPQLTAVVLGITDGVRIQVVSGLNEGDTVLADPPGIAK